MSINFADFLTVDQAARLAKLSPVRMRVLCRQGRLKTQMFSGAYLIPKAEFERFQATPRPPGNPSFRGKNKSFKKSGKKS